MISKRIFGTSCFVMAAILATAELRAQEHEVALNENALLAEYARPQSLLRARTELTLPFFEDFTSTDYYPDANHWADSMVYINRTLGQRNISLGVATFDVLDAQGRPYSTDAYASVYADSLSSHYFNLASYQAGDSIYLSFVYQGKGNGYAPAVGDSLMVYFQRSNGAWTKVWATEGKSMAHFNTAMIPVRDSFFLHENFRFRIVNKASFNVGNAHWHVDYIKLDAQRNIQDSVWNDVAFSYWGINDMQRSLTGEYTSMPYRHFNANRAALFTGNIGATLRNTWYQTQELTVGLRVRNKNTAQEYTAPPQNTFVLYNDEQSVLFNIPDNPALISSAADEPLEIEMEAFLTSPVTGDYSTGNDTIRHTQVFDNYFAYDDGSAEGAFFMTSYPGMPAFVAQEYALVVSDTLRAVDIYFPRQVPTGDYKMFYLQVYKKIDAVDGADELVYEQRDLYPAYESRINGLARYHFDQPVVLPEGKFYVALMFPAGGISDSLYIGLDKNKQGANYRYFKVGNHWESSTISGALMIRPVVGRVLNTGMPQESPALQALGLYPNPAQTCIYIDAGAELQFTSYSIIDMLGREAAKGAVSGKKIDVGPLDAGLYILYLRDAQGRVVNRKFTKINS